jgi:hypothetical protein
MLFLGPAAPSPDPTESTPRAVAETTAQSPGPAAPTPAPISATKPMNPDMPPHFVGSAGCGINFLTIYPIPSFELSLFLGGSLPEMARRPGHWIAVGYRGTLSLGMADTSPDRETVNLLTHRHQFAVQGMAGRRGRLAYGASLGVAVFALSDAAHANNRAGPIAIEAEGRIGYVFGRSPRRATIGGQVRFSSRIPEPPIYPTFGLFFSFVFGNGLPEAPR